jgi:hypothetical protein
MEKFKVYGLPCLVVIKGGAELEGSHREGAISRKDLVKYIEQHVGLTPAAWGYIVLEDSDGLDWQAV